MKQKLTLAAVAFLIPMMGATASAFPLPDEPCGIPRPSSSPVKAVPREIDYTDKEAWKKIAAEWREAFFPDAPPSCTDRDVVVAVARLLNLPDPEWPEGEGERGIAREVAEPSESGISTYAPTPVVAPVSAPVPPFNPPILPAAAPLPAPATAPSTPVPNEPIIPPPPGATPFFDVPEEPKGAKKLEADPAVSVLSRALSNVKDRATSVILGGSLAAFSVFGAFLFGYRAGSARKE